VSAFRVGARSLVAVRYRMLLFDDRVEEVAGTVLGLEIRRLFFDEAQSATVHRTSAAPQVLVGVFGSLFLAGAAALAGYGSLRLLSFILSLLVVVGIWYTVRAAIWPPYVLVLRTADQALSTGLPRDPGRRAEVVGRVARTVERYQAQHAPRPEAPPAGEPPA
jgi:hypothetical protein